MRVTPLLYSSGQNLLLRKELTKAEGTVRSAWHVALAKSAEKLRKLAHERGSPGPSKIEKLE